MANVETGSDTRQGAKGKPVLYVLIAALVLAAVAGAGVFSWQNKTAPSDPASQSTESARGQAGSASSTEQPSNPTNSSKPQ